MKVYLPLIMSLILLACAGETEKDMDRDPVQELKKLTFSNFEDKISYCIGFDHGYTVSQVYNGPQTAGKFNLNEIEVAMLDYLGDGDLKIEIQSIDSILDLYLGENGEVNESLVSKNDASYAIGLIEAQTLVGSMVGRGIDQTMVISFLLDGITDGMHNDQSTISLSEARGEVAKYYSEMNLAMGENFMSKNAQNENVQSTESGLQYEIIREGTGMKPNITDSCVLHYTGRFIDGRVFESTVPSGIPASFTPMGVIPGLQEGLLMMNEGESRRLFIPYHLAYGENGSGPVEPYSTLVFDVDLIKVKRFKP